MPKDYYTILGVPHNATDKDVRAAYRRLARKHHPDVNPGQPEAERRFKEINEAHEVLSDPGKRRLYDRYGHNWRQVQQFGEPRGGAAGPFRGQGGPTGFGAPQDLLGDMGFSDLLNRFFGQGGGTATRTRSQHTAQEQPVELSLEEAFTGAVRTIEVAVPGRARPIRGEATIPPGVEDGTRVRFAPGGHEVVLVVSVRRHLQFQRKGADLHTEATVPLVDSLLGGEIVVPTLTGRIALTVPKETPNGHVFRLAGQGMPRLGEPGSRGDLFVTVQVLLPTNLSPEAVALVRHLREMLARGGQASGAGPGAPPKTS
jgi:DnaJ-class molecular chaperone